VQNYHTEFLTFKLELELIQTYMAQKPMLRVEVCARCVARESKRKRGLVWVGKRGVQGACGVCVVSVRLAFFTWRSPVGVRKMCRLTEL